tara:strand:+ start:592 stop:744 length:153 start_codon:yes stop_codon:yes gene_type:complete
LKKRLHKNYQLEISLKVEREMYIAKKKRKEKAGPQSRRYHCLFIYIHSLG